MARFHYEASALYAIPGGPQYHEGIAHMDIVRALRDGDRGEAEHTTRQHVLCGKERIVSPPRREENGEVLTMLVESFV